MTINIIPTSSSECTRMALRWEKNITYCGKKEKNLRKCNIQYVTNFEYVKFLSFCYCFAAVPPRKRLVRGTCIRYWNMVHGPHFSSSSPSAAQRPVTSPCSRPGTWRYLFPRISQRFSLSIYPIRCFSSDAIFGYPVESRNLLLFLRKIKVQ